MISAQRPTLSVRTGKGRVMDVDLSRVARHNTDAAVPPRSSRAGSVVSWADERLGLAKLPKLMSLRKVFPDHWSFMLGEIALGASWSC